MLQIVIPATELWDSKNEMFIETKEQTLQLEHSLVSLSKWESKWCKPFMTNQEKTHEETLDYIRCMTITQNVKPETYNSLTTKHMEEIKQYIEAPMTATTFGNEQKGKINREQVTAELMYYWMISLNIPWECQKWHLNRLITLIKVCNIKNQPPKKRSRREILSQNAALNAARKKQFNTTG